VGVLDSVQADLSRIGSLDTEDAVWVFGFVTAFYFKDSVGNPIGFTGRKSSLDTANGGE
jgi:hypothetical protein